MDMASKHLLDEDGDSMEDLNPILGEYLLHCSICFESFSKAKILPCLHTFCLECIRRHYDCYKTVHNCRLVCPTCRDLIDLPQAGIDGLKDDCVLEETKRILDELLSIPDRCYMRGSESLRQGDTNTKKSKLRQHIADLNPQVLALKKKIYRLHLEEVRCVTSDRHVGPVREEKKEKGTQNNEYKLPSPKRDKQTKDEKDEWFAELAKIKSVHDVLDDVTENASPSQIRQMFDYLSDRARETHSHFLILKDKNADDLEGAVGGARAVDLGSQIQTKTSKSLGKIFKPKLIVNVFKKNGSKVRAYLNFRIGKKGKKPCEFDWPIHSFFLPDGSLLVSDKHNDRIQLIEADGRFGRMLLPGKVKPRRTILSPHDGLLYVSDEMTESLRVFDAEERPIRNIGKDHFRGVAGLALTNAGHVVMTDVEECFVTVHTNTGERISKFTSRLIADRNMPNPCFCEVNDLDTILVSDFRNSCIKFFKVGL